MSDPEVPPVASEAEQETLALSLAFGDLVLAMADAGFIRDGLLQRLESTRALLEQSKLPAAVTQLERLQQIASVGHTPNGEAKK